MKLNCDYSCFLRGILECKKGFTVKYYSMCLAKIGLSSLDSSVVLKRMKKKSDPWPELELPVVSNNLLRIQKTISHSIRLGEVLGERIAPLLSNPAGNNLLSYRKGNE